MSVEVCASLLAGGTRPDKRIGEAAAIIVATSLAWIIPKKWRAISTYKVAIAMLNAALLAKEGVSILESDVLH